MINPQIENLQISRCASPLTATPLADQLTALQRKESRLCLKLSQRTQKGSKSDLFFSRFFYNLELENFKPLFVKRKNIYLRDLRKFQVLKKIGSEKRKSENQKKE
jgi:hypothetical protein